MNKNKKNIYCIISVFGILLNLIFPFFAYAYSFSVPYGSLKIDSPQMLSMAEEIMKKTESRYGFDENILRNAKRKISAPRVEIFFDNTNPKPGEKVTAHAVPEFFKNDPQNLYYTWYLIHTKDGDIKKATNSLYSGKKEAAEIMARGDYDPNLDGQTYADSNKDPDNDGWPNVDANSYNEDDVFAPMGGADGVGGLPQKTSEQYTEADNYCRSLGDPDYNKCSYYTDTGSEKVYAPSTYFYTLQSAQTNYYCEECRKSLTSPSQDCLLSRNKCCYLVTNPSDTLFANFSINAEYCPSSYNSSYDSCYQDFASCNREDVSDCISQSFSQCKTDWENSHQSNNDEIVTGVSRCYKHKFGTNFNASDFRETDDSGIDYPVSCLHKWPNASGYTSGSGKFSNGEEKYWKTDPTDPDTDGDGFPDEADVIGLGQQEFSWNYQAGDRVGVVVEGTSMIPTDEKNAYYKIMWGYLDVCDSTKKDLLANDQCDSSKDYGFGFLATKSPNEQGEDRLKVSLSYSPDNPLADPSDDNKENITSDGTIVDADQINIISSLDNTDFSPDELYYTWQISKGDPTKNDWTEIKDIQSNFNTATPSAGIGITQFNFSPKKSALSESSDINYFKVTLTVSKASGLKTGRGRSNVIIPINTKGIKITLHKVDIKDGKATVGEEICKDGLYRSLCPVVRGQMLAAKVSGSHYKPSDSQFSWTLNGESLFPPPDVSNFFKGWSATTVFFPITQEEQEIEDISVSATPRNELRTATGTRLATVVHPAVFIKSADTSVSWPKVYTAENPDQKSAYLNIESSDAFEALTANKASYYLDFVPDYLLGKDTDSQISWAVNGTDVTSPDFYENNPYFGLIELENDGKTIKLPTSETAGAFTTLSATVKKYWSDDERNIIYSVWDVIPETLSGETSISIESVDSSSANSVGATTNPSQILAAIGTHLPHYFMYLLRLVLTILVMFVTSAGFYGLTQRLKFSDE